MGLPITAEQIARTRKFIIEILPAAGMTGDISQKVSDFVLLNAGAKTFDEVDKDHMDEALDLFQSFEPAALVNYIEESITHGAAVTADATAETMAPITPTQPMPSTQPNFLEIAMKAAERDEYRTLPILVGGKNPLISWAGRSLDIASLEEWLALYQAHIQSLAQQFPNANAATIAKPFENLYIDEDKSKQFRDGYVAFTDEPFPRSHATSARPDHLQSGWKQTDYSRQKLRNIVQGDTKDMMFSLRFRNMYVLAEGSVHPSGSVYTAVDSSPLMPIPDKLVDYILLLTKSSNEKSGDKTKSEGWLDEPFIHHNIDNQVVEFIGHYIRRKNIDDGDELFALIKNKFETNGCYEEDGITEFHWNEQQVRDKCHEKVEKWKTGEQEAKEATEDALAEAALIGAKALAAMRDQPLTLTLNIQQAQSLDVSKWREQFRTVGQMDDGPIVEVISGVLQEGICFIGANPGDGKTLVSLAFAKAICTGEPLFGLDRFSIPEVRQVIYLIPEARDRAFRKRCEAFQIPKDHPLFLARTTSMGPTLPLDDPFLLQAVRETHAVVFLDTAVRFMKSNDENSAAQNRMLVDDVIRLLQTGATCVVLVHHATKASANEAMTLENMLRGTGDFAAMCDQVYGIRKNRTLFKNGNGPMEIELASLKDREQIGKLTSLVLAASRKSDPGNIFPTTSIIDETGNFHVVADSETIKRTNDSLVDLVTNNPEIGTDELMKLTGMTSKYAVDKKLRDLGWHRLKGGPKGVSPWHKDDEGRPCPHEAKPKEKAVKPPIAPTRPKLPKVEKPKGPDIHEAVAFLNEVLAGTSPEEKTVPESQVYQKADASGISDSLIARARKRLAVVIGDDKSWSLPSTKTKREGEQQAE